jgi:hypothetical protein
MVLGTALHVATQLPPPAETPILLEVDCSLPVGRVLGTGGRVITQCPGFQRVSLQGIQDVQLVVLLAHQRSAEKSAAIAPDKVTRVNVQQVSGQVHVELVTRPIPSEELAAAPWDTLPLEDLASIPSAAAPTAPPVNAWKTRLTGGLMLGGLGVMALGLSAVATAGTRMMVGSEPLAGTFPRTGIYGVLNSVTLLTSPGLLVVGLVGCVVGIGAMAAGFFWNRAA